MTNQLSQLSLFDEPVTVEVPTKPEPQQQDMFSQRDVAQFGVTATPRKILMPVPPTLKMSRHNADGKTDEQLANEAAHEKQLPLPDSQLESLVQLSAQPDKARSLFSTLLDYTTTDTEPVALNPKIRTHSIAMRRAITSVVHAQKNGLVSEAFYDLYDGYSEKQRLALYAVLAVDCPTTSAVIRWLDNHFGDELVPEPQKRVDAESDSDVVVVDPDPIEVPDIYTPPDEMPSAKPDLEKLGINSPPPATTTKRDIDPATQFDDEEPETLPSSAATPQFSIGDVVTANKTALYVAKLSYDAINKHNRWQIVKIKEDTGLAEHTYHLENLSNPRIKNRWILEGDLVAIVDENTDVHTPTTIDSDSTATEKQFTVDYRNGHAVIKFKFSYPRKDLVKSIAGSRYHQHFFGIDKAWTIPPQNWDDMYTALGDQAFYTPEFEAVRDNAAQLATQQENNPSEVAENGQLYYFRKRVYIAFPYDEATKDKVKAIDGSKFHDTLKQWSVPLAALETVLNTFPDFHVDESIDKMKEQAAKAKIQADKLKAKREQLEQEQREKQAALIASLQPELQSTIDNPPLPAAWSLFEHQKVGIEFLVNQGDSILADDMGLGKTLMALLAARVYQKTLGAQIIVICPASVRQNWQKEARMFDTQITDFSWAKQPIVQYKLDDAWFEYDDLDKDDRKRAKKAEWRVKLVGYDAGNIIKKDQPFVLIADEAHYAQSMASNRSKAMRSLADKATATFLLSGTPAKNGRPINILPLLVAINHPVAKNKSKFKKRFCNPRSTFYGMDYNGVANLGELYEALSSTRTLLRRTKEQCLDLPEKTRIFKAVSLSAKAEKVYEERFAQKKAEYHQRVNEGKITTAAEAVVMLNFLRQAASAGKTEHAIELALEVMQQGKPVILFTEFKDTIVTIQKAVEKAGFPVDIIQGSTKGDDRQTIAELYQTGTPKPRCFIGTKAAQEGLTLTDADTVILIDRPWTPGDAIQREDRTWRIGQRNCVTAYWLQYGVDADIDGLILEKQANANQILTGERTTLKGTRSGSIAVQALKAVFED